MKACLMTKNPRWDHKEDYGFQNETRFEVWAWEVLKRFDPYREDYKKFVAEQEQLGEDVSDWKPSVNDMRPKHIHGFDPPKLPNESDKAWQLRCDEQGAVARFLSLSGKYGLKWGLMKMCSPDILYDEGVAFTDYRKFPKLIERYEDLEAIPSVNLSLNGRDGNFIHPLSGVIHFDLSIPLPQQMENARMLLENRVTAHKTLTRSTFPDSKERWLVHCRVKDAIDDNPKVDQYELAKHVVGEKVHKDDTSKAGYDLIRQAKRFFAQSKHHSILLGVTLHSENL